MEGAYAFTCQLCRARLTLVGTLDAAESVAWAGGRGLLVPPHLQNSVFDHTNVDESFIVLDGKRGPSAGVGPPPPGHPGALPSQPLQSGRPAPPSPQRLAPGSQPPGPSPPQLTGRPQPTLQQQPQQPQQQLLQHPAGPSPAPPPHLHLHPPRGGLEESFVVLGAASVLRPHPGGLGLHAAQPPPGLSPMHMQALQQQLQAQQQQQAGGAGAAASASPPLVGQQHALQPPPAAQQSPQPPLQQQQQAVLPGPGSSPPPPTQQQQQQSSPQAALPPHPGQVHLYGQACAHHHASPPQPRRGAGGPLQPGGEPEGTYGSPGGGGGGGSAGGGGVGGSGGGGGGPAGSGLDAKLQSLAQLFELASTNTQVDHPLCMDCVGQLKGEMETQIAEAEREIAAYSACLAQLEGAGAMAAAAAAGGGAAGGAGPAAASGGAAGLDQEEEYQLEEISRLEQERDQERARAEVLELELAAVVSELSSLSAAAADLASLEERYWHDVNDFELLLRAHTDERGALLAKIDRAGQRLQLLKNTSVLYDAFKIWHDGPFGTISGFRLGRTPEAQVEWDEINAAWGQAVLLLHTMAQMCKLQFSQHRLLPMGSHPRVADKRATYDLFGPVSKLWSANYDRAMVAYLACLREFGEHARKKDVQDGKPTPFNFPFPIDGDKVNNHTIKLTLNKDVRWTKALKFMLANLKIALQWCVKQDQSPELPQLQTLQQEGAQQTPEH